MKKVIAVLAVFCIGAVGSCAQSAHAKHLHTERWYQERSCNGQLEYRLSDGKRVDCLTKTHAIEHDFAAKWAECAGQALYYATETDRYPECVLIIEDITKDCKHLRALWVINRALKTPIKVTTTGKSCKL